MPVFSKIVGIFLRNGVYFLVSDMETTFVEHFHAFHVDQVHNVSIVRPHELWVTVYKCELLLSIALLII